MTLYHDHPRGTTAARFAVATLALFGVALPSAEAHSVVIRTSLVTTTACNQPANAATGAPAGLCQAVNPTQPGGNNNHPLITARIRLGDNGITLSGVGTANPGSLIFGRTYVSLIYLNPTVQTCSRFPAGQAATTVNTANADNDFVSMFLGFWTVQPDGSGTFSVYPGKMSPVGNPGTGGLRSLAAYTTVSIREAAGGFVAGQTTNVANNIAADRDAFTNIFPLRACGVLVPTF